VAKRTAVFWDVLHDPFSVDRQFGTNLNHGSTGEIAMFRTKNIVSIVALSVAFIAGHAGASTAGGEQAQAFKPFQGFTFQAGEKHAVGYFYDDEGFCKLVLTLSASTSSDPREHFAATRYEALVPAGQHGRYTDNGHAFEFGCQPGAVTMTFKALKTTASAQIDLQARPKDRPTG
jgi:hypothetical protein